MIIAIVILQAIVCAIFSAYLASTKSRSSEAWFFAGLLFGIFALIAIAGIPAGQKIEIAKTCPECAENIPLFASTCKYCRHNFKQEDIIKMGIKFYVDTEKNRIKKLTKEKLLKIGEPVAKYIEEYIDEKGYTDNHYAYYDLKELIECIEGEAEEEE